MATLNDTETPGFPDIYELAVDDPIEGGPDGVDNLPHKQLAERTAYLRQAVMDIRKDMEGIDGRVVEVEGGNSATLGRALPLSWIYSDEAFDFELFTRGADWRKLEPIAITGTTAADDSIDVQDTAGLEIGRHYVVYDASGLSKPVVIEKILSATRAVLSAQFGHTLNAGWIARTDWDVKSGHATAKDGQRFFSSTIFGLRQYASGRLIVRRDTGMGVLGVSYKSVSAGAWTAAKLVETRENSPGSRDETYEIGGGLIELQIVAKVPQDSPPMRIEHMVTITPPKAQMAYLVDRPSITAPIDGAAGIATSSPQLTASAYKSLYGITQAASEWQVATDDDFTAIVWQSTKAATPFNTIAVSGGLGVNATYRLRVRYRDADGIWSPWSATVRISTGATFEFVARPANMAPAHEATGVSLMPTLQSTAFAVGAGADSHSQSQWQVSKDAAFSHIAYDSGTSADLTSHTVSTALETLTAYYWRVRHKGLAVGWSDWSLPTQFMAQAKPSQPVQTAPANGAAGESLTPVLRSASFAVPGVADSHVRSQWQISESQAFASLLHDSGETASLTSYTVPAGVMAATATYYWRVRHKGNATGWSDWSAVASLRTTAVSVATPTVSVLGVSTTSATLGGSSFALSGAGASDTHAATDWEVRTAENGGGAVVWSSSNNTDNKTSINASGLSASATYHARCRYKGANSGWSAWSASARINTAAVVGEAAYTSAGTYSFIVPQGVTSISAVSVGAGASGAAFVGGGGGALAYGNSIPVTPGEVLQILVGQGGGGQGYIGSGGLSGIRRSGAPLVEAGGGAWPGGSDGGAGGAVTAGSGFPGGKGGRTGNSGGTSFGGGGGGGAGGYAGAGGAGADGRIGSLAGNSGSGGSGGGGGSGHSFQEEAPGYSCAGGAGGGVALQGMGASGAGGAGGPPSAPGNAAGGGGGSGGAEGAAGSGNSRYASIGGKGGQYGGGGGGGAEQWGIGGSGAVRIIWPGTSRTFPNNAM